METTVWKDRHFNLEQKIIGMCSIRRTKKVMKNSNGFFTLYLRDFQFANCLCFSESDDIIYHRSGIEKVIPEIGKFFVYWDNIKRVIIERYIN